VAVTIFHLLFFNYFVHTTENPKSGKRNPGKSKKNTTKISIKNEMFPHVFQQIISDHPKTSTSNLVEGNTEPLSTAHTSSTIDRNITVIYTRPQSQYWQLFHRFSSAWQPRLSSYQAAGLPVLHFCCTKKGLSLLASALSYSRINCWVAFSCILRNNYRVACLFN
jgi:hypothetical protein